MIDYLLGKVWWDMSSSIARNSNPRKRFARLQNDGADLHVEITQTDGPDQFNPEGEMA
jgi:hypothetical protein